MRIAILGIRGIPANYGGFETFAEELSVRLAQRGHIVTVYGRSRYIKTKDKVYRGVYLKILPNVMHKYLDTPLNTILAMFHASFCRYDILLYCNASNSFCTVFPRLFGKRVVLNVDGLEWKRAKWGRFGKAVFRISEFLATFLPDAIVTDAKEVQIYYLKKFLKTSTWIPYGAPERRMNTSKILDQFNIEKNRYFLYVSRLEPENNAQAVIQAFEKVQTDFKLVIVGDVPYETDYVKRLKSTNDPRIIFTGYVFGNGYREFQSHAYCYIQATEAGGTQPALVDAMGFGNCILANDVPQHREVLADAGEYFRIDDSRSLVEKIQYFLVHPDRVRAYRKKALKRVRAKYSWEKVTSDYEALFKKMV